MCTFAYMYCFSYGLRHMFKLLKTNTPNVQTSCKRQGDKKRDLATHKGTRDKKMKGWKIVYVCYHVHKILMVSDATNQSFWTVFESY